MGLDVQSRSAINNLTEIPLDGLDGLKQNWKTDIISGLLVSLIALPLCLAIAMASGFPAFGGLISAIVGGLIVAPFCGSRLTIKGPAAGLIAIAVGSVDVLGQGDMQKGYQLTLAVIVVAGLLQVGFALLRLGRLGDFFPTSAVHGMLAAIGIIIISKQIHPLFGVKPEAREPIELLLEVPKTLVNMNPEVACIGLACLFVSVLLPKYFKGLSKIIPAPLITVIIGITLGQIFDLEHEHVYHLFNHDYQLSEKLLVNVPNNFLAGFTFPDFSQILSGSSFQYILMFALIGSLESLLTVKAVDILDPFQRKSNLNKDLLVVGLGNSLSGLLGGLPMISEVVRSYANVSNGSKTRWANFFHGFFLLGFLVLAPALIHKIPISALAAILCVVGFKLASPAQFRHAKASGIDQLLAFSVTIVGTLATDLLIGVALGIITEYALCLFFGARFKDTLGGRIQLSDGEGTSKEITLPTVCYFGKIISFIDALEKSGSRPLVLDFSNCKLVDHSFMRIVEKAKNDAKKSSRKIKIKGLEKLSPVGKHETSLRRLH